MADENEILSKLVVEEKEITKEMEKLVEASSKYLRIEKPSGKIIFQNFGALSDKQRIAVLLLGKYFANRLKIIERPSLNLNEIAKELGRPATTLSGKINELITKGYVERLSDKTYKVAYHRINEIIDTILSVNQGK